MTVDEFVAARVLPEHREIVQALRALVHEVVPDATEAISYGIPTFRRRRALAVINPTKNGITFAFSRGADFTDSRGLLRGVGQVSKHLKLKTVESIDRKAIADFLRQAVRLDDDLARESSGQAPLPGSGQAEP